jgi:LmbE family N-acetylglucosaminyl deacetylase
LPPRCSVNTGKRRHAPGARHGRARCALLVACALLAAPPLLPAKAAPPPAYPAMEPPRSADVVLVVAPHPDDETLCCAGYMQRALAAGARVSVVWLTSGDAFELDAVVFERTLRPHGKNLRRLAETRIAEARSAMSILGVAPRQLFFLGYPDRGLRPLLTDYYTQTLHSKYTGSSNVLYAGAVSPGAPYQGQNLERDFEAVLDRVHATIVLAPSPLDRHPDHAAAGELALRALSRRQQAGSLRFWIVHAGARWPRPLRYHPDLPQRAPAIAADFDWQQLGLGVAERDRKLEALRAHRSQMRVMRPFLLGFVRADEIFALRSIRLDLTATPSALH